MSNYKLKDEHERAYQEGREAFYADDTKNPYLNSKNGIDWLYGYDAAQKESENNKFWSLRSTLECATDLQELKYAILAIFDETTFK